MRLVALLAAFLVGLGVLLPRALPTSAQSRLKVVSTVAPITNIVQNVGGSRIDLEGIIPPGVDSHTFEPAPGDARKLAGADLIVVNGLALEGTTIELAEANMKPGARILELGPNTITRDQWMFDFSFPEEHGDPNPHVWMNPLYAAALRRARARHARPRWTRRTPTITARTPTCSVPRSTPWTARSWRRVADHPRAEPQAAHLPRLVRVLRAALRLRR